MLKTILSSAVLLIGLVGCRMPAGRLVPASYIIGGNDITRLSPAKRATLSKTWQHSSVLIVTNLEDGHDKFCTGTLIEGENGDRKNLRVISNHHCYAKSIGETILPELLPEACERTHILLNFFSEETTKAIDIGCRKGSLRTDFEVDVSIFTLDKEVPAEVEPATLWDSEETINDRNAVVIHYPDVAANFENVESTGERLPVAAITSNDCKVMGDFNVLEWRLDPTMPFSIQHTCDLQHGSSGSALMDAETGKILGVNWGGIEIRYAKSDRIVNAAIKYDFIRAFIAGDTAAIKAERAERLGRLGDENDGPTTSRKSLFGKGGKFCGVLGLTASQQAGSSLLFLAMILLVPAVILGRRRSV